MTSSWTIAAKIECSPEAQERLADDAASLLASWHPSIKGLESGVDEDVPLGGVEITCTLVAPKEILAVDALNDAVWARLGLVVDCFELLSDSRAADLVPA